MNYQPYDEVVTCYDVLTAMAENLVEDKYARIMDKVVDKSNAENVYIKPPREIFYRKALTFVTSIPQPIKPRKCTFRVCCLGSIATRKCFSCTLFDPYGCGYYCDACFAKRHPWYRVPHMYTDISNDENVDYSLKLAHQSAVVARIENEGTQILNNISDQQSKLNVIRDDVVIDDKMRIVGRKATDISQRLARLRLGLRAQREDKQIGDLWEEAVISVQRTYRGYRLRRVVSLLYAEKYFKVWDVGSGREYYYDKKTGASSWLPPRFLLKDDLEKLQFYEEEAARVVWCCKRNLARRNQEEDQLEFSQYATVLQGFFRCIHARTVVLREGDATYRRVWDPEYNTYYYANVVDESTTWTKPSFFMQAEPPLHVDPDISGGVRNPLLLRSS
jgi:hypothetical protein